MNHSWTAPTFSEPQSVGSRDWGTEELLELASKEWMLKKLFIKKGSKGGLQYHRLKNEGGYLVSGQLLVRFGFPNTGLEERVLNPGDSFHFPPMCIHQEEALSDCLILEVSTTHFNDRVRVEDLFDIKDKTLGGLPLTKLHDIEHR